MALQRAPIIALIEKNSKETSIANFQIFSVGCLKHFLALDIAYLKKNKANVTQKIVQCLNRHCVFVLSHMSIE